MYTSFLWKDYFFGKTLILQKKTATTSDRPVLLFQIKGIDKDELIRNEDGSYELPTTLTLLVDTYQAKLLAEYENNSKIHAVLVSRGNEELANELLEKQNEILEEIEVSDNG